MWSLASTWMGQLAFTYENFFLVGVHIYLSNKQTNEFCDVETVLH